MHLPTPRSRSSSNRVRRRSIRSSCPAARARGCGRCRAQRYPKQLLPLVGRADDAAGDRAARRRRRGFAPPLVVCNEEHRFLVAEQLRADRRSRRRRSCSSRSARNTAPAVAAAALSCWRGDPDALMLVLPSDHVIARPERFLAAVAGAPPAAAAGALVTFGIAPTRPETGYGYIQARRHARRHRRACSRSTRFVEKPDRATAEALPRRRRLLLEQRHLPVLRRGLPRRAGAASSRRCSSACARRCERRQARPRLPAGSTATPSPARRRSRSTTR